MHALLLHWFKHDITSKTSICEWWAPTWFQAYHAHWWQYQLTQGSVSLSTPEEPRLTYSGQWKISSLPMRKDRNMQDFGHKNGLFSQNIPTTYLSLTPWNQRQVSTFPYYWTLKQGYWSIKLKPKKLNILITWNKTNVNLNKLIYNITHNYSKVWGR